MAEEKGQEYWFELEDDAWVSYLENEGYVVIKQVANKEQVENAIDLYWQHFEKTNGVNRNDPKTWEKWYTDRRGIETRGPTIQCAAAWFLRGLPKVKNAFCSIWKTDDLIVSMDSLLLWKPWWVNSSWEPVTEGLHMDQNPFNKPDRLCVQGMIPLYDVTEDIGGLEVVPRSNRPESLNKFKQNNPRLAGTGDFCVVKHSDPMQKQGKLLIAEAGDIVLWDSLTIHGGHVGAGTGKGVDGVRLARLSQTVCMVPRERASERVLNERKKGFTKGWGFTHWPSEANITSLGPKDFEPVVLTPEQEALL